MLRAIRAKVKLVLSENPSGLDGACWGETKVIPLEAIAARMSAIGTKRTWKNYRNMSAFGGKADMLFCTANVCF